MLDRLRCVIRCWLRAASGSAVNLERSYLKYDSMQNSEDKLFALASLSSDLFRDFLPYRKPRSETRPPQGSSIPPTPPFHQKGGDDPPRVPLASTIGLPIQADRLKFDGEPGFRAVKYLNDPMLRAGFLQPDLLRLPKSRQKKIRAPARVRCSRQELKKIFGIWDRVKSFLIMPASMSLYFYRCGLFAVSEDFLYDRQILNPVPENSRTWAPNESTKKLAHASLLCNAWLQAGKKWILSGTDLSNMYHNFVVSVAHARRNHIHGIFKGSEFAGWQAYDERLRDEDVIGCFNSLGMGENLAVETAQQSHLNVLRLKGALSEKRLVKHNCRLPSQRDFLQLVQIDDQVMIEYVSTDVSSDQLHSSSEQISSSIAMRCDHSSSVPLDRVGQLLFRRALQAYPQVGLKENKNKRTCDADEGTVLGGLILGSQGLVMPPPFKVLMLMHLTLQICVGGICTREILETLIGSWIYVLMFRKPFMSILQQVFHEGRDYSAPHLRSVVFVLSSRCKNELVLLCLLGPVISTNVRANPSSLLYATDASPFAAGVCSAPVGEEFSYQIFLSGSLKGHHTMLSGAVTNYFKECSASARVRGDADELEEDFETLDQLVGNEIPLGQPQRTLTEGILFDVIEVYRGDRRWSEFHTALGFEAHGGLLDYPPKGSSREFDKVTFWALLGFILRRVVRLIHFEPACEHHKKRRLQGEYGQSIPVFGEGVRDSFSPVAPSQHDVTCGSEAEYRTFVRIALLMHAAQAYGCLASLAITVGCGFRDFAIYRRLIDAGYGEVVVDFSTFGARVARTKVLLDNLGSFGDLAQAHATCSGSLFALSGAFGSASIDRLEAACDAGSSATFGRPPKIGEHGPTYLCRWPASCLQAVAARNASTLGLAPATAKTVSTVSQDWVDDLGYGLQFRKTLQYRFKHANHINVNEQLALGSLVKRAARVSPGSKIPVLVDSTNTVGANAKGRSSSAALNHCMRPLIPYLLGGDLYLGLLRIGTRCNPADDPSRLVSVRAAGEQAHSRSTLYCHQCPTRNKHATVVASN